MVAIAPKVGRPSRHSWRRRLSGAGFAEVKAGAPGQMADSKIGGRYHMDKSVAYRATLFLTHRARPAIDSGASGKQRDAQHWLNASMMIDRRTFLAAASS